MKMIQNEKVYHFFGIELRIVFYFTAFFFLLLAIISSKSFFALGLFFFLVFFLTFLLNYLDSTCHKLTINEDHLSLKRILIKNNSEDNRMCWSDINVISTREYGFFNLLKTTQINSVSKKKIRVFSFMEDYSHFLKDINERAKNAEIDKLTQDLLSGKADF